MKGMNNMDFPRFELISQYEGHNELIPQRATWDSAGYDFVVAEDTIIPGYFKPESGGFDYLNIRMKYPFDKTLTLEEIAAETKKLHTKPTLVPTGIKSYIPREMYLQLQVRSSLPLKHWLILANGVGIIDRDYYNNPDNEGHIYFQLINLSPRDILLKKGDKIGQGIFLYYGTVSRDRPVKIERTGGFGSTGL